MTLLNRSERDDAPMFPGGGYTDHNGLWRTDHRTVGEYRRDSIQLLLAVVVGVPVLLGVVIAVVAWLT